MQKMSPHPPGYQELLDDVRKKITVLEDRAGQLPVGSEAWVTVRKELVAARTELVELRKQGTVALQGGAGQEGRGDRTQRQVPRFPWPGAGVSLRNSSG